MKYEIKHREEEHRFCVEVDGYVGYVEYVLGDVGLNIIHTIVPSEIGRRGIAGALVKAAYDYALVHGLKPVATCSYAKKWLERHHSY